MVTFVDIIRDLILFSVVESFIFCYFFEKIGNTKRFEIKEILFIAFINCIISKLIPPMLYQMLAVVFMGCYIYVLKGKNLCSSILLSFSCVLFAMVVEITYAMLYEFVFNGDVSLLNNIGMFLFLIPIRFLEIFTIRGGVTMKMWLGEIEKRK